MADGSEEQVKWNNGMLEYWNDGVEVKEEIDGPRSEVSGDSFEGKYSIFFTNTPSLQHSITPQFRIKEAIMDIKVLGPGCPKCQQTEKNVKEAIAELGVEAKVEKVANLLEIAKYGVFGTPAVVVDGQVKCVGKIPTKDEIKKWIAKQ
jgi:small redox-active disulfide protein 2